MKICLKKPGSKNILVECGEQYRTACAKLFLGEDTTVTFVRLNSDGTLFMAVDEDGCMKRLEPNFVLECRDIFTNSIRGDVIVGRAVFMRIKQVGLEEVWDYEVDDLTDEDLKIIENIFAVSDTYEIVRRV